MIPLPESRLVCIQSLVLQKIKAVISFIFVCVLELKEIPISVKLHYSKQDVILH